MRSKFTTLLTVIGAVTVLVLAANTVALATTGKAILAGKINTSAKLTSLVRTTPGTGLQVRTKSNANAPFAVNGTGKVVNLNVDKVDGLNGGDARAYGWSFSGYSPGEKEFVLNGIPVGRYLISYEFALDKAQIPDGTSGDCYLVFASASDYGYTAETADLKNAYGLALSGSGLITVHPGDTVSLICRTSPTTDWTVDARSPVRITAIPIGSFINKGSTVIGKSVARTR